MQTGYPAVPNTDLSKRRLSRGKNCMNVFKRSLALCLVTGSAAGFANSQSTSPNSAGQPTQALTAAELSKVKSILAPYKSAALTTNDAKLIKRTLRDAGLRRSPALDAALNSAGFSAAKLDQLDPPPPRPPEGIPPPPKK